MDIPFTEVINLIVEGSKFEKYQNFNKGKNNRELLKKTINVERIFNKEKNSHNELIFHNKKFDTEIQEKEHKELFNNSFSFFALACIAIIIGVLFGCIYYKILINNISINTSINSTIIDFSSGEAIISKQISFKNIIIILICWIVGISVIGSPFLLLGCLIKGFKMSFVLTAIIDNLRFHRRKYL